MDSMGREDCVGFFITLPHGLPHAAFRGFISFSGEWILLGKKHVEAEGGPHITMQRISFSRSLGLLTGVSVL